LGKSYKIMIKGYLIYRIALEIIIMIVTIITGIILIIKQEHKI